MKKHGARRSRAFWVKLVGRWQASGKSQREVAEAAEVSLYTLRHWVAKLRAEGCELSSRAEAPRFVEVRGVSVSAPTVVCRLRLSETMTLEMSRMPELRYSIPGETLDSLHNVPTTNV